MIKTCMETWRTHLQEYEFVLWNEQNSPMDIPFVRHAYSEKKYAFVADYVRFWALYNYGGIYLDTDMYLIKNLNIFLKNELFFGFENQVEDRISGGLFGGVTRHIMIKNIMNKYSETEFKRSNMLNIMIPYFITNAYNEFERKDTVKVYPYDYFYPLPFRKRDDFKKIDSYITERTYAIHMWDKSWFSLYDKLKHKVKRKIRRLSNIISN
jgi:mannosyltransferase OCH1-like enzyme